MIKTGRRSGRPLRSHDVRNNGHGASYRKAEVGSASAGEGFERFQSEGLELSIVMDKDAVPPA